MERIRENQRKMPFSSSRRSYRGIVSKQSSGIWKVENEGIDSIRERYRIMDHYRLNGRMRRGSLIATESSDESFDGEMAEERTMNKAWFKVYDEIIGAPVPRRARSGLKRRPQDSVIAAQPSNASTGRRKEMLPISESEVEVAKFLFGLTRLNSQDSDAAADTFQSSSVPDISTISKDSKRKKSRHIQTDETGKSSVAITCNSKFDGTTNQVNGNISVPISSTSGQQADSSSCIKEMAASSPKLHKISSPNNSCQTKIDAQFLGPQNSVPIPILAEEKPSPTSCINAMTLTSPDHHEQPNANATCKTHHEQTEQLSEMESQMKQDLPPLSPQNEKLDPHKSASSVSSVIDRGNRVTYEIDLMALPDDGEGDATDEFNPQVSGFDQGTRNDENTRKRGIFGLPDKMEIGDSKPKQNSACLHESHTKEVRREGMDKQPQIEVKTGSCQDDNNSDKIGAKQHSEKIVKDGELPSGRAGLSNNFRTVITTPNPISVPCWPGSIRPFGFPGTCSAGLSVAPALQGTTPVEGKTLMPHARIGMLPPTRPGHCATHCFIAQLIHFQQQLVKLNPLWQAAGSSDKPYNLSLLPRPGALVLGGPDIRNPNATIGSSVVSLNCQYPVSNHSDSLKDTEKGRHLLFQQVPQGGVFLFPINQMQSQTAGQKASHLPTSIASSASTSNSCSNSVPDPRYLTMFKGSYPFPNSSAYQSYIAQQQRPPLALIPGSSSSSQPLSLPLQLIPNPTVSTVSSSQKCLQANQFRRSRKTLSEAHLNNKPEHSGNSEVSHSQRTLQNYRFIAEEHCQPLGLLTNQAKTLPRAQSSRSRGPSEWNHLGNQAVAQTNSAISTPSTLVSTSSIASSSDQNNSQQGMCSLQKMPKPENYLENNSIRKDSTIPSSTTAAKTQQTLFSTLVSGQQNKLQLKFPGSLNMRKPTISQQAHPSSSMELTIVAAVSYVQGAANLPMKSAEQKPAAG